MSAGTVWTLLEASFSDGRSQTPPYSAQRHSHKTWRLYLFRHGRPIYMGEAIGSIGLQGPLKAHFAKGRDLSRSTLRASLAAAQLGIDRSVIWLRPSVMSFEQVTVINQWLGNLCGRMD